jgi:hypothetical protein
MSPGAAGAQAGGILKQGLGLMTGGVVSAAKQELYDDATAETRLTQQEPLQQTQDLMRTLMRAGKPFEEAMAVARKFHASQVKIGKLELQGRQAVSGEFGLTGGAGAKIQQGAQQYSDLMLAPNSVGLRQAMIMRHNKLSGE